MGFVLLYVLLFVFLLAFPFTSGSKENSLKDNITELKMYTKCIQNEGSPSRLLARLLISVLQTTMLKLYTV